MNKFRPEQVLLNCDLLDYKKYCNLNIPLNFYFDVKKNPYDTLCLAKDMTYDFHGHTNPILMFHHLMNADNASYRFTLAFLKQVYFACSLTPNITMHADKGGGDELIAAIKEFDPHKRVNWYIENTGKDWFYLSSCEGVEYAANIVCALRKAGWKAYLLIDSCHVEMNKETDMDFEHIVSKHKDIIGAYHLSFSQDDDGYEKKLHGRPYNGTLDDTLYMENLTRVISKYTPDALLIPEVTEDVYGMDGDRSNGLFLRKLLLSED